MGDLRCPGEIEPGFSCCTSATLDSLAPDRRVARAVATPGERAGVSAIRCRGCPWSRRREPSFPNAGTRGHGDNMRRALLAASHGPESPREWWSRKRREGVHPRHGNGRNGLRFSFERVGRKPHEAPTFRRRAASVPARNPRLLGVTWSRFVLHRPARRRAIDGRLHAFRVDHRVREHTVAGMETFRVGVASPLSRASA